MAIEFRCEKCGKALSVEPTGEAKIKCPHCKAKVTVPAGLAALPRPKVPPSAAAEARPAPAPASQAEQADDQPPEQADALMKVMSVVMPWVISVFFHVGILVILGFFTIVLLQDQSAEGDATVPDAQLSPDPGGVLDPGESDPEDQSRKMEQVQQNKWAQRDSAMPTANLAQTQDRVSVIGLPGPSVASSGAFGLSTGGDKGPRSNFFGTGGNAYHIVYVVDRSGSMLDTLDLVKLEMLRSISRLSPKQTFHVIFFAKGEPMENPPRRLVYATEKLKREASVYLDTIQAQGQTDPIPALSRAFQVLKQTPNAKRGKLIYLLTDGEFSDNERVLKQIRQLNKTGDVYINTILHHHRARLAVGVLESIAKENGGRFKFVPPNE